jgi:hypothetical protein
MPPVMKNQKQKAAESKRLEETKQRPTLRYPSRHNPRSPCQRPAVAAPSIPRRICRQRPPSGDTAVHSQRDAEGPNRPGDRSGHPGEADRDAPPCDRLRATLADASSGACKDNALACGRNPVSSRRQRTQKSQNCARPTLLYQEMQSSIS